MHKITKNDKEQFERKKKELNEKTRFLKNSLKIPFMEAKGVYHVLAEVLGLENIKENIFEDKFGNKFALTKYGFEDCVQFNYKHKCNELERILKDHTEARLANFQKMQDEIKSLKTQPSIKDEILDILENEDNLYKKIELIEKLVNY